MEDVLKFGIDEDSMRFGKVDKVVGSGRFMVQLDDGRTVNAAIRDLLASKSGTPVGVGTLVLIHLPDWEKDKRTNNSKPVAFIEGVLDNDQHVPVLKKQGKLPEWMFSNKEAGAEEGAEESYAFVSEEAERVLKAEEEKDDEEDDEDDEDAVPSNSASAAAVPTSRKTATKAREQDRSKARVKKEFSIDDI
jgi:translation initiation factor IF-1